MNFGPYVKIPHAIREELWYGDDEALACWLRSQMDELSARLRRRRRVRLPNALWLPILAEFGYRCAYCGAEGKLEQDHRMPVALGGVTSPDNIVPACKPCNVRKGAKHPDDWPLA